ncbi:hypothetical protein AQUCO_01000008v1 [Aquilegia coerulea]|uniref:Thioredoxin domain-containing protein n=1 Tax=Aquilegia coerulea TaxID=218851 RepID=A0A2G5E8E5_AQUCA|nr:hypothetical protein AQUCO_01000008v1 [Aquilegia coerulea]PIA51827.1 hypothetical protein AQUCO_01000008v1 [Aquilegia coerulea]
MSRFAAFSILNRARAFVNLQKGLGSCRRFQSRNYSNGPKYNKEKLNHQHPLYRKPSDVKSSSWFSFLVPAGLLLFAGTGAVVVHKNDERRSVLQGQGSQHANKTISGPMIGGPFNLFDTERRLVTERDLLGKWVLLYFGYTSSPDVGPEEVEKMAKVLNILDSKQKETVVPVFVTLDPQRDTPSQLRAYLKEFDHRIIGLTGPVSATRQIAHEYRVYFKKIEEDGNDYLIDSSHKMYLLDPKMEIVRCFGVEYNAEQLSKEILTEMSKKSE